MRLLITNYLVGLGHSVIGEAENGDEGVTRYKELHPDVVTLDITMPIKDGLEACKEILDYDSKAKVIMVSAMGQEPMVLEAIQYGAKDFIVKPFKKDRIAEAMKKVV
jgi:two-component system chemotaxis response regulator CheY